MAGVDGLGGSNNIYTNVVGGSGNVGGPQDVGGASNVQSPDGSNVEKPATLLGGVGTGVSYSQPSPLQSSQLVLPDSICDSTNVDITSCLVLLLQSAIEMRKDQREQWIKQAQNALATSNNAADMQKQAAAYKLAADCVTNGVSAATSVASFASSCVESGSLSSSGKSIAGDADSVFGSDAEIDSGSWGKSKGVGASGELGEEGDEEVDGEAQGIIGKSGLTKSSLGGESIEGEDGGEGEAGVEKSNQKALHNNEEVEAKDVEKESGEDDAGSNQKTEGKSEAKKSDSEIREQRMKKAEYISRRQAFETKKIEAKAGMIKAAIEFGGAAGKTAGSALQYESDITQAEAAKIKALADFQNTAASDQLDFANELRDYANSILSTIRDVESARHAASNAIANI